MFNSLLSLPSGNYKPLKIDFRAYKGGSSAPSAPSFQDSEVLFGNTPISKTYKDSSGNLVTQYMQTPQQQELSNWTQQQIASILPNVNTLNPNTQQSIQNQVNAIKNNELQQFQNMYNPLYQSTLDDINRRFGGLNNSALNDSMYQLNQQKNQALTGIANDVTGNTQNLANNYLQQQYNYLNALMGNQNYGLQNAYNALNQSNAGSNMGNQFNNQQFGALANMYNAGLQANTTVGNSLIKALLG